VNTVTAAPDMTSIASLVPPRSLPPARAADVSTAKKAASQFESVFVSQFLGSMFEGVSTDPPFGGGEGEAMFRSLMLDQYANAIESRGGFGLSAAITHQLLHMQESHSGGVPK